MASKYELEIEVSEKLARQSGAIALSMQDNLQVEHKDFGEGPVTDADKRLDVLIVDGLRKEFPDDLIISEESLHDEQIPHAERIWFVDPIDGTKDYIAGHGDFSIMIGLCVSGKPMVGVVFQPSTGILWRGDVSERLCEEIDANNKVTALNTMNRSADEMKLILSHRAAGSFREKVIKAFGAKGAINKSSVGLKMGAIVRGDADLYVTNTPYIKVWDTCGPAAILLAAGGYVGGIDGKPLPFDKKLHHGVAILAGTKAAVEKVMPIIERKMKRG